MSVVSKQSVAKSPASRRRGRQVAFEESRSQLYWPFLAPALAVYVLFFVGPSIAGIYVSLTEWHGTGDQPVFVGFNNFARLFRDDIFLQTFTNTSLVLLVCGMAVFAIAFFFTALFREIGGRRFLRAALFIPYIVAPIAVAVALSLMLTPAGPLNTVLTSVGLGAFALPWLSADLLFKSIMVGIIWVSTGFYVVLLLSGVERIPPYLYEDAALAGVNQWQKFWQITVPLSWDIISVAAVLWVVGAIRVFEFVWAFSGSGNNDPLVSSRTMAVQQYLTTIGGRHPSYEMGYGAAIGVFMLVMTGVLALLVWRVMRRDPIEF
jgi:raffinose/stachyose/melibiose transport system permease protein